MIQTPKVQDLFRTATFEAAGGDIRRLLTDVPGYTEEVHHASKAQYPDSLLLRTAQDNLINILVAGDNKSAKTGHVFGQDENPPSDPKEDEVVRFANAVRHKYYGEQVEDEVELSLADRGIQGKW